MISLKRIASKILILTHQIQKALKPKLRLSGNTVVIDSSSWKAFKIDEWRAKVEQTGNQLFFCKLEEVDKKDWKHITAYIGKLNPKQLEFFSEKLRWLQIPSHGFNGFEKKILYKNQDIVVSCVKDIYSEPIAQYCMTAYYLFNTFSFRPQKPSLDSCRIVDKRPTILVIGLGNIGMALAEKAFNMGWRVYGIKRHMVPVPNFTEAVYPLSDIDKILHKVDYVVNLLPENNESVGFYNIDFFRKMQPSALFCNVGRKSAVIDEDINNAVKYKIIRGAILDAHNEYKYPTPDIILTGHTSSLSSENNHAFDKYFSGQLKAYLENATIENQITLI